MGNSVEVVSKRVKQIVDLAKEIESEDPIDWGMLNIDEEAAYIMMATSVLSQFDKYDVNERDIMISTIVKLIVENFMLNVKLNQGN